MILAALALGTGALSAQSLAPNASAEPRVTQLPLTTPAKTSIGPSLGLNATGAVGTKPTTRPGSGAAVGLSKILVYDNDTQHGLAADAAFNVSFFGTTVATSSNFNSLLTSQSWDVVAVDSPNFIPSGGWTALINHVNAGGAAILSFWDWDNSSGFGQAGLTTAFDVSVSSSISFTGTTLTDAKVSPAFLGVTMPNSSWGSTWNDDGDQFTPLAGAQGLAHIGTPATPVLVRGNGGKTIAAPVLDEAGAVWVGDGSGVQLWENMIRMVGNASGPAVLVYDDNTLNQLALTGAFEAYPGTTERATASDFNARLTGKSWDAVLVDCPSTIPSGGWGTLTSYVNNGGHVVLSFWDWDLSSSGGDPALNAAFDVSVMSSFSWFGLTLFDAGTTNVFSGVSMPNSSWNDNWSDDGDRFAPLGFAKGIAHVGSSSQPVLVWGNAGRTIAAPVFDEAGPVWLGNGSGVQLWKNMLAKVFTPDASCSFRGGVLGLNPPDFTCITPPVMGGTWSTQVSTVPKHGTSTLSTYVTLGIGGPTQGIVAFGYELLILPPYLQFAGLGTHNVPVTQNPYLVGVALPAQAARIELGSAGQLFVVLTNGQDTVHGY
jgi:hypothetical protein